MSEENDPVAKLPRKVVYLLGTGFTVPLGLPTMGNWTAKAQSMVYYRPGYEIESRAAVQPNFKHQFDKVTRQAERLSISKNYYIGDLFNMEDLFSMLWMRADLQIDEPRDDTKNGSEMETAQQAKATYIDYIRQVIRYYTPRIGGPNGSDTVGIRSNWRQSLFGLDRRWNLYGLFFAALFNLDFHLWNNTGDTIKPDDVKFDSKPNPLAEYTIMTTNYDRVPEIPLEYIRDVYTNGPRIDYRYHRQVSPYQRQSGPTNVGLAKIHGDIDGPIVPPIANKGDLQQMRKKDKENRDEQEKKEVDPIEQALELAAEALQDATDLRIIGYSLPVTDTYIKYLLRAVITNSNLQNVHVIVKDSSHEVRKRYDKFICCTNYQFVNGDVLEYLEHHMSLYNKPEDRNSRNLKLDKLEQAHFDFMRRKRG